LLAIGFAAGCGGGGGSAFEGMYAIDAWNVNPTSCADDGPSVLGDGIHSETVFYVEKDSFLGSSFLNTYGCVDLADCQMKAAEDTVYISLDFPSFEDGNDDDGWSNVFAYGDQDFTDPTMCNGYIKTSTLIGDDTSVTMRMETINTPQYPVEAGDCSDEGATAAGAGQPCSEVEVIHGNRTGDI
jgi:hypothetical protein